MSVPMLREAAYDEVFHAQRHFRSILDSVSRPGAINELDPVECFPPGCLNRASALVAFALMNVDVTYHLVNMGEAEAAYLSANTGAGLATIDNATFIFVSGHEAPGTLEGANCGTLVYPDTSATIVIQVDALSQSPLLGSLKLTLEGPGVDGQAHVYVHALSADLLLALQARNSEFPLGIDAILSCDDGGAGPARVLGIPRTARVSWQPC